NAEFFISFGAESRSSPHSRLTFRHASYHDTARFSRPNDPGKFRTGDRTSDRRTRATTSTLFRAQSSTAVRRCDEGGDLGGAERAVVDSEIVDRGVEQRIRELRAPDVVVDGGRQ